MKLLEKIKEAIKESVEQKREQDKIYKEAYNEAYKKELVVKAKNDAKARLDPNKKRSIQPIFKQGLVDTDESKGFTIGDRDEKN